MKYHLHNLQIDLPYENLQLYDFQYKQDINNHGRVTILAEVHDSQRIDEYLYQPVTSEIVKVTMEQEGTPFFTGCITDVRVIRVRDLPMLEISSASMSIKWDIEKKSRSFQNNNDTYKTVIDKMLQSYQRADWQDKAGCNVKVPGLLLQYEETDWEFMIRLASHFQAYVVADTQMEYGRAYLGIPHMDYGVNLTEQDYTILQDLEEYQEKVDASQTYFSKEENMIFRIQSRSKLQLGEQVTFHHLKCQVASIHMKFHNADVVWEYDLRRLEGMRAPMIQNERIRGLSLPAIIKQRKGNCLRVHFDIDSKYIAGNNCYYTYAIESTSWYCLPDAGSRIHIYFPEEREQAAIATHAMHVTGASNKRKYKPSEQTFSNKAGMLMKLDQNEISFDVDDKKETSLSLDNMGNILITGTHLKIGSELININKDIKSIYIHVTDCVVLEKISKEELEKEELETEIKITISNIICSKGMLVNYLGSDYLTPSVMYSDADLRKLDAEKRAAHNTDIMETQLQGAMGKFGIGAAIALVGVACLYVAANVLTAGLANIAVAAVVAGAITASTVAVGTGVAQAVEAGQDIAKIQNGDFSKTYNLIRDEFMGGNQEMFDSYMFTSVAIAISLTIPLSAGTGTVAVGVGKEVAKQVGKQTLKQSLKKLARQGVKQALVNGTLTVGMTSLQDMNDGYIDIAFEDYAEQFGTQFGIALVTSLITGGLNLTTGKFLTNLAKKNPLGSILLETGIDGLTELGIKGGLICFGLSDEEIDVASVLQIFAINLVGNVLFSIDPVDGVTGGFLTDCEDMSQPLLAGGVFAIRRRYNSLIPTRGMFGRKWILSYESCLYETDEHTTCVLCLDGHVESFTRREDGTGFDNSKGESLRYLLSEHTEEYQMYSYPERITYVFDMQGKLIRLEETNGMMTRLVYEEKRLVSITHTCGYRYDFTYVEGKVSSISDQSGRVLQYHYENDLLHSMTQVDEGITTYHYDDRGNITKIINQNEDAFVENQYDAKGRVIAQYYLDGTMSTMEYKDDLRINHSYMECSGKTETYEYDTENRLSAIVYEDGSRETYEYDIWWNRTYEQDRQGGETFWEYSPEGLLLMESHPTGMVWNYTYDNKGNLLKKTSNSGETYLYTYDDNSNLLEEKEKIEESKWKITQYSRDVYGRVLTKKDSLGRETVYDYEDKEGVALHPTSVTDALGQTVFYKIDSNGRTTSVENSYGKVEMAYDAKGRCILRRDGLGNVEEKQYDYMGNLRYVTPPNLEGTEKAWSYRYNYFNHLIEKQDPLGNHVLYERDLYGHITSETSLGYGETQEDANRTNYIYDKEGNRTHIRYPDGSVERFWYDKKNHMIKHVTPEYYQEETDDGVGTCYEYDQGGRLTATYQEDGSLTNRYGYHPTGRLLWEEDGAGNRITYTYDLAGNLIQKREPIGLKEEYCVTLWEYDACGNQILEKQGKEAVSLDEMPRSWHTIWFAYDALNRLILVKDSYGAKVSYRYDCLNQKTYESYRISKDVKKVVRYYYDAAGNLIKKEEELASPYRKQPSVMPPNKAVTTYTYDKNKNLIQQIEPSGATKEWHYDVADRLVEERIVEEGSGIDRRYGYTYDPQGRIVKAVDYSLEEFAEKAYVYDNKGRLTHYQNEEGGILRLFYDKNNRIQRAVLPKQFAEKAEEGAGPSYSYNLSGDVTEIRDAYGAVKERYGYDQSGRRIHITNGAGDREEAEYDKAGNLITLTRGTDKEASHQKMHYNVQGYLTGVQDGNGNDTQFVTDDWGRITEIHTPDGGVEMYAYDYGGNLILSQDTYGNAIEYTYNSQGRVCEILDQDGLLQQYVYDEEGRPLLHLDRNGNQIHTTYNMDQQLLYRQAYEKGQNKVLTERYRYDAKGLLKESIGGGITYHYHHSKAGHLLEKRSGKKLLLSYQYDKNGNCIEETDQKGETLTYQYDDANQLREIHQKDTHTRLASYAYDKAGRIKQTICGNGMETRYEYDSRGMLKDLQTSTPSDSLYHCHYTYDSNGNRTKREGQGVETTYGYDSRNRLTQWEMEGYKGISYEYDFNGNRIYKKEEEQETFYTYNRKNQLVSLQNNEKVLQFLYDNQGNLLGQESASQSDNRHYAYDALNRQTSIITGEGKIQRNLYDAEGMRYQKDEECGEENKVIQLVYDRNKNLVSSSLNEKYLRVVGGSFPEALLQKGDQETIISYYGKDEQGSILHLTDEDGRVKNKYQYDAFGAILESKEEVENPLTYTGQEYDEIPTQYYLRARYYNPLLGRFLQEDTYHGDGLNLYTYCQNNPIMYYDPSGYKRSDCKQDTSGRVDEDASFGDEGGRYSVDPEMFPDDETAGVLRNGSYVKNPTAHSISDYINEGSNYLGNKNMNGQYMYVVDMDGNIIMGTRGGQRMPHPTLVGGSNPQVQAAGMMEVRGGKIYSINNASGHFKPSSECLNITKEKFAELPGNIFSKDFKGFLPFGE